MNTGSKLPRLMAASVVLSMLLVPLVAGAQESTKVAQAPAALAEWSRSVWASAQAGRGDTTIDLLTADSIPIPPQQDSLDALHAAAQRLTVNLERREEMRAESLAEAHDELREAAEKDDLLEGLRAAIEIDTLQREGSPVTDDPDVARMVERALVRAREAESNSDWLEAHGLYARLHLLFDEEGTYRDDVRRLGQRRTMLRFYAPELLHELVNKRRQELGEDPLPPFNALGEDWRKSLKRINDLMVAQAIATAATRHVDSKSLDQILSGGYRALHTFVTTDDLAKEFPGLADKGDRDRFIEFVDKRLAELTEGEPRRSSNALAAVLQDLRNLQRSNARTIGVPREAMLHEFADGAMGQLDDFSSIIWPGDMEQFQRTTSGTYKGVGIQISLNEASEIRVVTPLADTPAARAGIRPGDLIRKVNGHSTLGMGLLQAVDLITGDAGTAVTLSIERESREELIEYQLTREEIPIHSIRGWERTGPDELDWDWFIDEQNRIGYVRLTQFTNHTTSELELAINEMRDRNMRGLILDLRGNPGGLLSEAVGVMSLFIERGVVVTQENNRGQRVGQEVVRHGRAALDDLPVVVLVNGGSASASEIVAGALQDYSKAVIVGDRTFGKGSVQHVLALPPSAMFKLTTQYYRLPGREGEKGRLIHRKEDSTTWGIEPDVHVEMLPDQFAEAFRLRQQADVVEFDRRGNLVEHDEKVEVEKLIEDGLDPQLETALLLIQSQVMVPTSARARLD